MRDGEIARSFHLVFGDFQCGLYVAMENNGCFQLNGDEWPSIDDSSLEYIYSLRDADADALYGYLFDIQRDCSFPPKVSLLDPLYDSDPKAGYYSTNMQVCAFSLTILRSVEQLYARCEDSRISCQSLQSNKPFAEKSWNPSISSRQDALRRIIYFESRGIEIDPQFLNPAIAVCVDNSLYVPTNILSDPIKHSTDSLASITRLMGDIGRIGITILVAPTGPMIRNLSDNYNVVQHALYDFKRGDNFKGTSLHLEFTEWNLPLNAGGHHMVDQEVYFVESLI